MWRGPEAYGHATAMRILCGVCELICGHDTSVSVAPPSSLEGHREQGEERHHGKQDGQTRQRTAMVVRRSRAFDSL
jgi:hypothetical protein